MLGVFACGLTLILTATAAATIRTGFASSKQKPVAVIKACVI
jgi:hypothetical protein